MYNNWIKAYNSFSWVGDLTKYKEKELYPEHFQQKIDRFNLHLLEEKFHDAVNNPELIFHKTTDARTLSY